MDALSLFLLTYFIGIPVSTFLIFMYCIPKEYHPDNAVDSALEGSIMMLVFFPILVILFSGIGIRKLLGLPT